MAELKTKKNAASVEGFLNAVEDEKKRADALALLAIFERVTGEKAVMWGTSIVGFGQYHYESERSAQKGDWPLTGFSPRKANITVYVMPGFDNYGPLLEKIGKVKTSKGCLYFNRLSDIDTGVLEELIRQTVKDMKAKYGQP